MTSPLPRTDPAGASLAPAPMISTLALGIAEHIGAFSAALVSDRARQSARAAIADTVGVTLAGAVECCTRIVLETLGGGQSTGDASILGTRQRAGVLDAALVNGVASHALDFDDFCITFGGHQSVPLVPALFALAEARGLSGEDVLIAYLAGVETEVKIGRAVNFHHYDKGWHPTATLGIFGTVAAASHLLRLPLRQTALALSIATSLASGIKANFGTMVKPLHVGQCCRNGLLAVLLAKNGYDANLAAFEHPQGFLNVFNGAGHYDADRLLDAWTQPLEAEARSMSLKQFPCCGSTHPAIMMMIKLVQEEGIRAGEVTAISIGMHARRLRHIDNPHPRTPLQAKFSVQYVTARALLCGTVHLEDFEGAAFEEPAIQRLLAVTSARVHAGLGDGEADQWAAEVTVTLRDGRVVSRLGRNLVGRSGENPMSDDELWDKFDNCASRTLAAGQARPLFDQLLHLDEVADMRRLSMLMMPA